MGLVFKKGSFPKKKKHHAFVISFVDYALPYQALNNRDKRQVTIYNPESF